MTVAPVGASTISVLETLHMLDNDFGAMAAAFEKGEFALWVGSGISRRAPSLGNLVTRAIEFLRAKTADAATSAKFRPALTKALKLPGIEIANVEPYLGEPFTQWPNYVQIRDALWNKYSDLLDVRLPGEPNSQTVWNTLAVTFEAHMFIVSFGGERLFEVMDSTFSGAGKVGLWTKAHSITYFDDFPVVRNTEPRTP
jgi:hypothetical protein